MVNCFAPGCSHNSSRHDCSFRRIPLKDDALRKKWLKRIRRDDRVPGQKDRLCSCHFVDEGNVPVKFAFTVGTNRPTGKLNSAAGTRKKDHRPRRASENGRSLPVGIKVAERRFSLGSVSSCGTTGDLATASESRPMDPNRDGVDDFIHFLESCNSNQQEPSSNAIENDLATSNDNVTATAGDDDFTTSNNDVAATAHDDDLANSASSLELVDQLGQQHTGETCATDKVDCSTQTPNNSIILEAENYFLLEENKKLREKLKKLEFQFSIEKIKSNDSKITFYTGFPNYELLQVFFDIFTDISVNYYLKWRVTRITREDQIFLTLIKLRLNLGHVDLAERFNCSEATVTNIFVTWIHVIHEVLFKGLMTEVPSILKNRAALPSSFDCFRNCRIIIDCTEVFVQVTNRLDKRKMTWSGYKHRNTFKALVGVAPNGTVTYASPLYPGSTSDKEVTKHCGILDQLKPGDLILADKGFLISDILPHGVAVNLPPFLCTPQFTPEETKRGINIARVRIHVERAIGRIKDFDILDFIPQDYFPYASKIWQVCVVLGNFRFPLINELGPQYSKMDEAHSAQAQAQT